MIKYNLRYRGPFEYDKLLLNILQLFNDVQFSIRSISEDNLSLLNENNDKLLKLQEELINENGLLTAFLKMKMKIK